MLIQSHLSPDLFGMYYPKFGSTTIYEMKKSQDKLPVYHMHIYLIYFMYLPLGIFEM